MYDFYKNPPTNKKELKEWLLSWLQKPHSPLQIDYNGETFIQKFGFKLAFYMHYVYRSTITGEYIWWVYPCEETINLDTFPKIRYPDFKTLLEYIIDDYYVRWNLEDK